MASWFMLVVRRQREKLAGEWLARCSIGHRIPLEPAERIVARRRRVRVMIPVLPGYVGLYCPAGANLFELRDRACEYAPIRGLLGLKDGTPLRLRDDWEDRLRFKRPEPEKAAIDYGPGDKVRLILGAFSGLLAECVSIEDGQVTVLMPMFNSTRAVPIPPEAAMRAA